MTLIHTYIYSSMSVRLYNIYCKIQRKMIDSQSFLFHWARQLFLGIQPLPRILTLVHEVTALARLCLVPLPNSRIKEIKTFLAQ